MKKRELYRLEKSGDDAVIVYRTDNNYGRQGVVFRSGGVRLEHTPFTIPQYIKKEALQLLNS